MKGILHMGISVVLAVTALFSLTSCEDPQPEESAFLVNKQTGNSSLLLSPEGGSSELFVVSDAEWNYQVKEPAPWLSVNNQKVNSTSWMLVLTAGEYTGDKPRQTVLVFTSEGRTREVTVVQNPEDPILQVTVPGIYGVDGANLLYERTRCQISRLTEGNSFRFTMLYPSEVKAVSVTVPASLEAGDLITVGYKVVEKDRTLYKSDFPSSTVLRVREPLVWIKAAEGVYFIIRK